MRDIFFKVCFWNDFNDRLITLYEDKSLEAAEHFALNYTGERQDIFIKKVYRMASTRREGSDL